MRGSTTRLDQRPLRRAGGTPRRASRRCSCARRPRASARRVREVVELEVRPSNADARVVYERWGFRESMLTLAAPVGGARRAAVAGTATARRAGSCSSQTDDEAMVDQAVRTFLPQARPLGAHRRPPARERLGRGRRRALQRRPAAPSSARAGALVPDRRRRAGARHRGGRGRPLRPLRARLDRRRVRVAARVPRAAAARRRRRAEREPDGRPPADGRGPRAGARGGADGELRSPSCRRPTSCSAEIADVLGVPVP